MISIFCCNDIARQVTSCLLEEYSICKSAVVPTQQVASHISGARITWPAYSLAVKAITVGYELQLRFKVKG